MKLKNSPFFSILVILSISLISLSSSCQKEGCTDENACNYDSAAKKDDGTCNYGCNNGGGNGSGNCINGENRFYDVLAQKNINCFDNTFGSPVQGQVFSVLTIIQNRFETCVNGAYKLNGYTENIIKFRNVTSYTITFDYVINQNLNGNYKQYQGYVSSLSPGQTYEINTGNGTFYNLNYSQLEVNGQNISYN